ncbi:MAG: M48 family metallopeptidase [Bacteroidales bacterium]|nr:M48 family metallopeptidase [Bacteroidales bacterium]
MKGVVTINDKELKFNLLRSCRRSVTAKICKDGTIEVRAPLLFGVNDMTRFLQQHWRWLTNHYDKVIEKAECQNKAFVSGEAHYFLGEKYELKVVETDFNSVNVADNYLIVNCKDAKLAETVLKNWYREMFAVKLNELLPPIIESFRKYNVSPRKFSIRDMKSRWGSCSRQGNISLNIQLVKLNENCIRQVVVHEMCHLVYFDHQSGFYSLMDKEFPEWKKWKPELKFL